MKKDNLLTSVFLLLTSLWAIGQEMKPAWGSDINVAPESGKFYQTVRNTSAYDGTLFVGRLESATKGGHCQSWSIYKSTDDGATWTIMAHDELTGPSYYTAFDILAAGENASDFRLYVATPHQDTATNTVTMTAFTLNINGLYKSPALSFDGETYNYDSKRGFSSVAWATDSRKPSLDSDPFTINLLATKAGSRDSLIGWGTNHPASGNFTRKALASATLYMKSVDAAIGVSTSKSNYSRMGAVYLVTEYVDDTTGRIFVRYTYGDNFDELTGYDNPIQVGNPSAKYGHPQIALSQTVGAGSGPGYDNIRTIVSYDVENDASPVRDLDVNFKISDDLLTTTTVSLGTGNIIGIGDGSQTNPHLIFDPESQNFLLTYYDGETGKMAFVKKSMGSTATNGFTSVVGNYRDATTKPYPYPQPRVSMNYSKNKAIFTWNDNFLSMFDTEFDSSIGISDIIEGSGVKIYPNPAHDIIYIQTERKITSISLIDIMGRQVGGTLDSQNKGINVSNLASGVYQIKIEFSEGNSYTTKIIKK